MKVNNLFTIQNPKSVQAEAYRILRTNLQFSSAGKLKTIVVTSAAPGDGKSTSSINMAITLAQAEKRVLLIDCDLRKSTIHKYLRISNQEGLTNVLAGMTTQDKVLLATDIKGLQVITAGPTPPNPAELLHSQRMKDLLKEVREQYDYVILDTPPVVAVTDGSLLSTLVDGTILVVSAGNTPIDIAKKAKENLEKVHANILGVVLNKIKVDSEQYYYYDYGTSPVPQKGNRKKRRKDKKMEWA
ncbi:CpsD/CapB family tyrosine-protein kinase [Irregularibacter muris]|uniref:non-specific protein-tyrosine kinase n=1 Tax=Irregularibacter muris TaxID=1796619 RepID=A0AAE3HJV6_9FIRM|nr:CpsD/CapB family tyrosine-protein kinase [Irregularibacter muris]MCR1900068.1 CpsD/CapB family tyrosine-protein kinase [Irregularibacter muris]